MRRRNWTVPYALFLIIFVVMQMCIRDRSITGSLYAPVGTKPDGTIIDWKPGNGDGGDVDTNM